MKITDTTELAKLGSNVGGIGVTNYSDHSNIIKDWTLLYLDGKFRTNANLTYPNVNSYVYDSVNIPNKYNAGTTAYAFDGTTTGSGDKYKWIVFKILKSNTNYVKLISKVGGGVGKYYIDVPKVLIDKGMSSNIYSSSAIGQGKSNTANVVGFIRITASKSGGGTGIQIGNFNAPVFQNTAKYGIQEIMMRQKV